MGKIILLSLNWLTDKYFGYSVLIILGVVVLISGMLVIFKKTKIESDIGVGLIFISLPLMAFGIIKLLLI